VARLVIPITHSHPWWSCCTGGWLLDKVTRSCNKSDRTCVWTKDQRESKGWCYAVWMYARERNYWCNLPSTVDAREIWV